MTFRYCGYDVYQPAIVHGVHGYHADAAKQALETRLASVVAEQNVLISGLKERPLIPFNADDEFDADGRLNPDAPVHSPFVSR